MAIYKYKCPSCEFVFDVYKAISDIDELETCPTCGRDKIEGKNRLIQRVYFYGEKPDEPFYSQALGKVVKSRKAQSSEAKARGWEEVGNTDIEKHINQLDSEREKRSQERWDDLLRG